MCTIIKHFWLPLLAGIVSLTTGCTTSALHESNADYVKQSREFRRTGQRLPGTYLGIEHCNGVLSEVYQFENPFQKRSGGARFEVLVPVYGVSRKQPIRAHETSLLRTSGTKANLWFWVDQGLPDIPYVKDDYTPRIDICLRGKNVTVRRYIPESSSVIASNSEVKLKIPWRRRSRAQYAARNLAYACTVPLDAALCAGVAVGYCFLVDPCMTVEIIRALD